MQQTQPPVRHDPFGADGRERLLRRLAGTGAGAVVVTAVFARWFPPAAVIGLIGLYLVGVPLSYGLERRWPSRASGAPLLRYTVVAVLATVTVFGLLGAVTTDLSLWVVGAYGLPVAAILGPLVSTVAYHLPRRWLATAATIGVVTTVGVAPALVWLEQRPPAPHDFMVVNDTDEFRATFQDARGLADAIAVEFDDLAAEGHARLDQDTWIEVADRIRDRDLGDHEQHVRSHLEQDLPTLRSDPEQPVRLITTIVRDAEQACVAVTRQQTASFSEPCRDLDLAR
ncbi:MAG: hypothetical protein EA387_11355 [Nitriliruptor sp.]|nr:MAG: hypothetical protein EA387_11355 [Nitriliruptor sp.]